MKKRIENKMKPPQPMTQKQYSKVTCRTKTKGKIPWQILKKWKPPEDHREDELIERMRNMVDKDIRHLLYHKILMKVKIVLLECMAMEEWMYSMRILGDGCIVCLWHSLLVGDALKTIILVANTRRNTTGFDEKVIFVFVAIMMSVCGIIGIVDSKRVDLCHLRLDFAIDSHLETKMETEKQKYHWKSKNIIGKAKIGVVLLLKCIQMVSIEKQRNQISKRIAEWSDECHQDIDINDNFVLFLFILRGY